MSAEEKLIDPAWLVRARKNRRKFIVSVVCLFVICTLLAFWLLPNLQAMADHIVREGKGGGPQKEVSLLFRIAGVFKLFWAAISIGCGVGVFLALTGKIDNLLPILNFVLLLAGIAAVAFTFYVYYAPALTLIEGAR